MKFNIKKTVTLAVAVAMLTGTVHTGIPQIERFSTVQTVYADTQKITVLVDGKQVDFSKYGKEPFIENGTTYVPFRSILEEMGVDINTNTWNTVGVIMARKNIDGKEVSLATYKNNVDNGYKSFFANTVVDGSRIYRYPIDGVYKNIDGRLLVPIRIISEPFGANVDYDGNTKTIKIDTKNPNIKIPTNAQMTDEAISISPTEPTTPTIPTEKPVEDEKIVREVTADDIQKANELMLEKVNALRLENGVAPLVLDDKLINLAQMKADDMVQNEYFAHESPTYGKAYQMYEKVYGKKESVGENINKIRTSADADVSSITAGAFGGWKSSDKGHLENMINPKYTKIGFAYDFSETDSMNTYRVMMLQY